MSQAGKGNAAENTRTLLKTYIITLPEAVKRRRFMEAQLANFPFMDPEFVSGPRGAELTREDLEQSVDEARCRQTIGRMLTPNEVGCSLTHLDLMRRISKENLPVALILEDDALISGRLGSVISDVARILASSGPQILLLTPCKYLRTKGIPINEDFAVRPFFSGFYSSGYLVNLAAARTVPSALLPLRAVIDWWNVMREDTGVTVNALVPYLVGISISEHTVSYLNLGPSKRPTAGPAERKGMFAKWREFGDHVVQGLSERVRGIRGQRLVF